MFVYITVVLLIIKTGCFIFSIDKWVVMYVKFVDLFAVHRSGKLL